MAVRVFVSHSGQYLAFEDPTAGLDSLKSWIEHNVGIPPNRQILMTPRGKNIKSLSPDAEIFVYDKKNLSQSPDIPEPQNERLPDLRDITVAPESDADLEQWKEAARTNRTWALEAAEKIRQGAEQAENLFYEADTISRSVLAALDNVKNYLQAANQKFEDTRQWAHESNADHEDALSKWEKNYTRISELPVRDEVASILRRSGDQSRDQQQISTLSDLIAIESLRDTEQSVAAASKVFRRRMEEIQSQRDQLRQDTTAVEKHVVQVQEADVAALVEEAETLAKRISRDYDEMLKLQDDQKSLAQASRKTTTQFRDFIPSIQAIMADTQQAFLSLQETRNSAVQGYFAGLKEISASQSRLSSLQKSVADLDFDEQDGLNVLYRVLELPIVYGCTLIEATRRSEWTNRMQAEVDSIHTDLTQVTEDEQRRRKKWTASYDDFLNKDLNVQDALIDIKASKPRNAWPFVEREEINAYIDDLKALGLDDAVEAVVQRLKDLETTQRRQKPRAFKNGSVQDLAASSNLGNGDVRTLQDDKARLEQKVSAAESRVRKLEDLLHRQSQASRPTSGLFTPGATSEFDRVMSPSPFAKQSELPHRPSISLRRQSNAQDERVVVQKINTLEAQIQKLQNEAHEERRSSTESRDKMQEAESVKQDLMANFESQKQEFEEERQLMDDENHKLKVRIEELEDELDRILGSKEATKLTHDQKLLDLKTELDTARDELRNEQQHYQNRIEDLDRDFSLQREKTASLERQLQECKEERNNARDRNVELARQLRVKEETNGDVISTLQNTHSNLSPAGSAPDDIGRLARALEILSEGAGIHARRLDDNLQLATAENKSLEEKAAHNEQEIRSLTGKLSSAESRAVTLNDKLEYERDKLKAIREELAESHSDLDGLRTKLAAGETGSDTLRERLSEEEQKVNELQELKHEHVSTIQSLKHEIEALTNHAKSTKDRAEILKSKLGARGDKARQLSERLYQHNDRIIRMLEQFGFSISRQDDALVIQRASKVSASTILSGNESSTPMKRTVSGSGPAQHYSDPTDLDTLYWTSDTETNNSEETKYQTFLSALKRLDLDSTLDIVSKRYKDVENLAKKYQKDSRTYRERAHRLQSETHDKIAYRSFKEGDLALFLPTRNQATRPWAAFNVGAPHYFLREQDHHKLQSRDWLLARISRVEERVVDLSRSLSSTRAEGPGGGDSASARSFIDDENPFELSDGLRWYLIDAAEEKPGAPGTPSVGKSTVIASTVEAEASISGSVAVRKDRASAHRLSGNAAALTKTLNKSLESRRSSSASKRSVNANPNAPKKDSSSLKDVQVAPLAPIVSGLEDTVGTTDHQQQGQGQMVRSAEGDKRVQSAEEERVFDIDPISTNPAHQQSQAPTLPPTTKSTDTQPPSQTSGRPNPPSRTQSQSPLKQRTASPAKKASASTTTSPSKKSEAGGKGGWERLFNVEFNA